MRAPDGTYAMRRADRVECDSMGYKKLSQLPVFFCKCVSLSCSCGKCIFETKHFLLESLDIKFLSFSMSSS